MTSGRGTLHTIRRRGETRCTQFAAGSRHAAYNSPLSRDTFAHNSPSGREMLCGSVCRHTPLFNCIGMPLQSVDERSTYVFSWKTKSISTIFVFLKDSKCCLLNDKHSHCIRYICTHFRFLLILIILVTVAAITVITVSVMKTTFWSRADMLVNISQLLSKQ